MISKYFYIHLPFLFYVCTQFRFVASCAKTNNKRKQPLYASRTHKVAAPTSVQSYIAAADHPSVPHVHLY